MAQTKIVFGEWLPDQPGVTGALTEAKNCIPVTNGYVSSTLLKLPIFNFKRPQLKDFN